MKEYKAVIVGVMFDNKYEFEDILVHGIATSPTESFAIEHQEIMRLYEDFGEKPLTFSESRSEYDEPIVVVQYSEGYEHIYCYYPYGTPDKEEKKSNGKNPD